MVEKQATNLPQKGRCSRTLRGRPHFIEIKGDLLGDKAFPQTGTSQQRPWSKLFTSNAGLLNVWDAAAWPPSHPWQ